MQQIEKLEKRKESNLDLVSGLTGEMLGEVFCWKEDVWKDELKTLGFYMGKFIYLMDAYEDFEKDKKNKKYRVTFGNTIDYSNIRIYPADYSYMSNSVTATNRSCVNSWNFPTPTRTGYNFLGWNTKPDGSGTTYNSSNSFPTSDLVLYSQWKISKINKIYIGTSQPKSIYVGTSEVKAVYVGTTKVYG